MKTSEIGAQLDRRSVLRAAGLSGLAALAAACQGGGRQPAPTGKATSPAASPRGSEATAQPASGRDLLFSSNRGGNYEIYRKRLATGHVEQLTNDGSNNMNAVPSPDGSRAIFYSDRSGNNRLFTLDLRNPGKVEPVAAGKGAGTGDYHDYDPTFLPDGRILFKSTRAGNRGDIFMLDGDNSKPPNLTHRLRGSQLRPNDECWKPEPLDNDRFLFTVLGKEGHPETNDLWLFNLVSGGLSRVTNNHLPDWFPASNPAKPDQFAFISRNDDGSGPDGIYLGELGSPNRRRLTIPSDILLGDCDDPSWGPDGQIVFLGTHERQPGNRGWDIFQIEPDGTGLQLLDAAPSGHNLSPVLLAV